MLQTFMVKRLQHFEDISLERSCFGIKPYMADQGGKKIKAVLISKILAVIWEYLNKHPDILGKDFDTPNTENNFSLGEGEEATDVCTS